MRGLIDSIKKSLVLCLVCTLSVSRVDFTSFAIDKSDNKPVASQSIKIATSFYDVDHIYNADKHYGAIFSKYASVPVDFNSITDYSDYSKSNIEKVTLHDNTASLDRDLEEKSEWNFKENKFVPYFPVDAYPSLGYYRISIDSLCKSLFDDYCKSNTVDGDSKSDVKKAFDSFLLDDFQLSIKFKDGFSLSCDVNFKSYPYKEKNEGYLTSIDDLIDDASDYSYQGDTGTTDIISVPTSKTIKNKDFYNTDDNAIFDVEEGKDYNTYYVDLDSNNKVKLPLDDISKETVVTDVKLGDDTVYSSPQSLVLNSDNSTSNNTVYIVTGSSMFYGSYLNNLDSIFNRAIDELKGKGITRLTYKGKNYDLNSSDLSFDGVNSGDFLMNAKVPSVVSYSGVNGYECKGWRYNTYDKPTDLHDILSNNSSVDFDAIIQFKKAPEVSKFNKMKSIDFSDVKPSSSWRDTCVNFKYTTDLSLKSDSDGYDNKYYEPWSFFDDVNEPNYNLLRFYADSNYKLPDDYVSKYKRSAVFGMIPDLSKLTSIKSKNRDINVFRVPVDSKDMDKFLDYLDSSIFYDADEEKLLNFIRYNNEVDVMTGRARWYKDHMFGNIDGYYYFPYSSDTVNNWGSDSYIISKDDVIKMLNTCFSDCDFKSDEDFYNSDYFAGASYNFDVSNISQDKIDKWWSDFGSNGKTKCRYDKSNKVLSVPCYYIYYFMLQESGVFYDDLKEYSTLPVYCYTLDTNLGSTVKYNDVPSVEDLMLKRSLNYDIISTFCSFRASDSSIGDSGFKVSNINSLDSYIESDLDKESTYVTELRFWNEFGKEYDNLDSSYWNFLDKIDEVVSECTRLGFDIDYDLSIVPDTKNLKYNPISDFLDLNITKSNSTLLVDSDSNTSDGCFANPVKSASSGKALSNDSGVANNILTLDLSSINKTDTNSAASSSAIRVYDKRPIYVQVKSEIMSNQVKNAKSADYAWIHDNIDFSKPVKDYTDVASSNVASFISTYVNYKFGNIVLVSKPAKVSKLGISNTGEVSWGTPKDQGLGVNSDGTSVTDDVVYVSSYTLTIDDKTGKEVYKKSFNSTRFSIPANYNKEGYKVTVVATNVLGDSDEVSIVIPAKATSTPTVNHTSATVSPTNKPTIQPTSTPVVQSTVTPSAIPTIKPTTEPAVTATPTIEPTVTPTVKPTASPTIKPEISPTFTVKPTETPVSTPNITVSPTVAPTEAPVVAPTIEPTVEPTEKPEPVPTKKPTSTPKPTNKPAVVPIKISTPEPTKKPVRVTYLAQTGIYDIKKVVSAGVLIISGLGLVIIALRRRKK